MGYMVRLGLPTHPAHPGSCNRFDGWLFTHKQCRQLNGNPRMADYSPVTGVMTFGAGQKGIFYVFILTALSNFVLVKTCLFTCLLINMPLYMSY